MESRYTNMTVQTPRCQEHSTTLCQTKKFCLLLDIRKFVIPDSVVFSRI
jgi:hypothetical protein